MSNDKCDPEIKYAYVHLKSYSGWQSLFKGGWIELVSVHNDVIFSFFKHLFILQVHRLS